MIRRTGKYTPLQDAFVSLGISHIYLHKKSMFLQALMNSYVFDGDLNGVMPLFFACPLVLFNFM
jgi:hypothetical protein